MVIIANASVGRPWSSYATGIQCGLLAGATFLFGAFDYATSSSAQHNSLGVDGGVMLTGIVAATLGSRPVRERAARLIPIDPESPVHSLALTLAVILVGTQLSSVLFTDVLAAEMKAPSLTFGDLFAQEVPFLVMAFLGVGLFVRRTFRESAARLGVTVPAAWHLALGLGTAGAFYAFSLAAQSLSQTLTPSEAHQVDRTTQHVFSILSDTYPWGVIAIGIVPGICEEVLFRGALQPRLGLLATAFIFTSIHTEYALSIDLVTILSIAIGLGFLRKYTNTTASGTCHIAYNLLTGFGLAGLSLNLAIAAEVLLAVFLAYSFWGAQRRRAAAAEKPTETTVVR